MTETIIIRNPSPELVKFMDDWGKQELRKQIVGKWKKEIDNKSENVYVNPREIRSP